jgi:hypothetical protein
LSLFLFQRVQICFTNTFILCHGSIYVAYDVKCQVLGKQVWFAQWVHKGQYLQCTHVYKSQSTILLCIMSPAFFFRIVIVLTIFPLHCHYELFMSQCQQSRSIFLCRREIVFSSYCLSIAALVVVSRCHLVSESQQGWIAMPLSCAGGWVKPDLAPPAAMGIFHGASKGGPEHRFRSPASHSAGFPAHHFFAWCCNGGQFQRQRRLERCCRSQGMVHWRHDL